MKEVRGVKHKDNYFVQGSAAHQIETAPNPQRERQRQAEEERRYRYHLALEKARLQEFSVAYMAGFVVVVGLSLFMLGDYVKEEATLYMQSRQIQTLQNQLDNLVVNNDATEARMENFIDLNVIEEVAMKQYGMIYPEASQIREYEKIEGDYIRQYENIPD